MKVGILSMQRVINYGSFWQAYLLKKILEDKGNKIEFIDILPGKELCKYKARKFDIKKIKYYLAFRFQKRQAFNSFFSDMLGVASSPNFSSEYDRIIIGSDEVFNFAQPSPWGFSPQLHGAIDNENVSSYAASFGSATLEDVERYGLRDELVAAMSNLRHISVRDKNSYDITKELLPDAKVYLHFDPVLVGDLPVPERQDVDKKYIVIYAYNFRFNDKDLITEIRKFAKQNGFKIYSVGFYQSWVDKNIVVDPYQILQYFVNAEYIITDTFHGTIFSVRCHKKFATVIRDGASGNRQKLSSLLNDLKLGERELVRAKDFEKTLTTEIDYNSVDEILNREKNKAQRYLDMCLYGEPYEEE